MDETTRHGTELNRSQVTDHRAGQEPNLHLVMAMDGRRLSLDTITTVPDTNIMLCRNGPCVGIAAIRLQIQYKHYEF